MALSDKNIVITPNISSSTDDPKIVFSGADSTTGAQNITLKAYPTNSGTLSFEGSAGQLFSISNSLSGTIFSVNDISGIPSIEVLDTGTVRLAQYSGNVGIGTSTPTQKLSVSGGILRVDNTFGYGATFNNTASTGMYINLADTGNSSAVGTNNGNLLFYTNTNTTERMRLDSTGNLGLGAAPTYQLDLVRTGSPVFRVSNGTIEAYVQTEGGAATAKFGSLSNHPLAFATNGTERARINTSGNLGLGVTPSAWSDGKAIEFGSLGSALWGLATSNVYLNSNAYYNGGWKYADSKAASNYQQLNGAHIWFNAPSGTAGNPITFAQAMTLDASGNLGIGTTSPVSPLTVGNLPITETGSTSYGTSLIRGTNYTISNTQRGILDIEMNTLGAQDRGATLSFTNNMSLFGQGLDYVGAAFKAGKETSVNTNQSTYLAIYTNNSGTVAERMRLDASGNLGIGTTSPESRLAVKGTSASSDLFSISDIAVPTSGVEYGVAMIKSASTDYLLNLTSYGVTGKGLRVYHNGGVASDYGLLVTSAGGDKLIVDGVGNLGLGVTPSAWGSTYRALDVRTAAVYDTSVGTASGLTFNAIFNGTNWVYKGTGGNATAIRYHMEGGQHQWYTAPSGSGGAAITFTQAMTLDASGNLAVGVTSAGNRLDVGSGAGVAAAIGFRANGVANAGEFFVGQDAANSSYVYNRSNAPLILGTNNAERLRIDASGNVTPGVTNTQTLGAVGDVWSNVHATTFTGTTMNITPGTTGVSTGLSVINGDITTYRSGGTTGVIYLTNSGSKYLYFDGTNYNMPGGNIIASNITAAGNVTGSSASCTGNASSSSKLVGGATADVNTALVGSTGDTYFQTYANAATNKPVALDNANGLLTFITNPTGGVGLYGRQFAFADSVDALYTRNVANGSFSAWSTMITSTNYNTYSPTLTGTGASGSWGISVTGSAATFTSTTQNSQFNSIGVGVAASTTAGTITAPKFDVRRDTNLASGIRWYSNTYTAWQTYMSNAVASSGAGGNITAPAGTLVTSWALRNFIENSAGYGWTWESGTSASTTPVVVAELRSSDGSMKLAGAISSPFHESVQTISTNYTITSGSNAMTPGPITIASGVTVTVPNGSVWTIV